MVIPINSILHNLSTGRTFRKLDVVNAKHLGRDDAADYVLMIDMDASKTCMPEAIRYSIFLEQLGEKEWRVKEETQNSIDLSKLSSAERRALERRWNVLNLALKEGPRLFCPGHRSALARRLAEDGIATRPFLYSVLGSFWRNGMTKQALVPAYRLCGAPGTERVATDSTKKVGRKRTIAPGIGAAMTREHREKMAVAIAKSEFGKEQKSLPDRYHSMLVRRYPEYVKVVPGEDENKIEVLFPDRVPSYEQFFYYWKTLHDWNERQRIRLKPRGFEKFTQLITTGTLNDVRGPGARYYIDATVLDLYIVSRFNPNRIIGRPTLYIVADQFSRMIVGFYLGLEPPCWVGAMLALWNCNLDKVALCAHYGIQISADEWPTGYMPLHLMGDRGELASHQATALAEGFRFDVENAKPYAGEAKGVVERDFNTLQAEFGPWLPGAVDKKLASRDADPPALLAAMNLDHAIKMVVCRILLRNFRVIREYEGAPELTVAGVAFTPLGLWHWGEKNLRQEYRRYSDDHLIRYLWPEKKLKLNKKGLKFYRGMYLMGVELRDKPWFYRALHEKHELEARYHPQMLERMYVLPDESHSPMIPIGITRRSAKFAIATQSELEALELQKGRQNAAATWDSLPRAAQLVQEIANTRNAARKTARDAADKSLSKAERMRDIRPNRDRELELTTDAALHKAFVQPKTVEGAADAPIEDKGADLMRTYVDNLIAGKN